MFLNLLFFQENRTKREVNDSSTDDIGYIMFECGLEGVSIKVSKHSQFDKTDPGNDDKMTNKTDSDTNYADSIRSYDECNIKNERSSKIPKSSVIDEFFKKKDSSSSKPSTPNLGCSNVDTTNIEVETLPDPNINAMMPNKDPEKATSCLIELKTAWFNFAAPPRTPITKKIDCTRY